ncbi:adenylyl-sulfate kinase [Chryseobacterium sp. G0240]|uniref:adenylyl-sulfate kinase n=1 Tax=Chryseobacterium sp. G0240 TaxID=2487066 RepID=UPI000F45D30C|nr:adenylyl-sulfate kinase [Chryseobacterium sp. G0240]ROI03191.1 adenylyl-sulfate kinase [Chryseobacterium sp. G0240]
MILNLTPQKFLIDRYSREVILNQKAKVLWFTGLSGSGKSTLANQLEFRLNSLGFLTYLLDGDNIRNGINKDLDFTETGRTENLRRIAEIAKLFLDANIIVLASFISPLDTDREMIKSIIGESDFRLVFVDTPLEICEERDIKGLYQKARRGEIKNFTGISSSFELPQFSDFTVQTSGFSIEECTELILEKFLKEIQMKMH